MVISYPGWRDAYQSRLKSPDDAVQIVQDGDLVAISILCPEPLVSAFVRRAANLARVDVRALMPTHPELFNPALVKGEIEVEAYIGDAARPAIEAGTATFLPNTFGFGMRPYDSGRGEVRLPDVFLTPCSEPNEQGYVHFGPNQWQRKSFARRCPNTIAIVDPNMSQVYGDVWMHVSEFHTFIEGAIKPADAAEIEARIRAEANPADREELLRLLAIARPEQLAMFGPFFHVTPPDTLRASLGDPAIDPEAQAIADHIRQIIRDGDTLQVGVGQPSSLMFKAGAFDDAKHLGIHTEVGTPGLAQLWARGIVDGSRKTIFPNKCVAVAWGGSAADLAIIHDNPAFELHPPEVTLNPTIMSQNHQMTSVNSAIAVDIYGQIASEDLFGGHLINGAGGQPDTHISAVLCPDGRAITVLRSTALGGSISKIVAKHEAGTFITIPRYFADTIVTEHGVARLMGKSHRQRVEEMTAIAHPDFRAELRKAAAGGD